LKGKKRSFRDNFVEAGSDKKFMQDQLRIVADKVIFVYPFDGENPPLHPKRCRCSLSPPWTLV